MKFKIKIKNIVIESIGLILLIFGIEKLFAAIYSEEYMALLTNDMDKFESLTNQTFGAFFALNVLWGMGALLISTTIIIISKFLYSEKKGLLNTLIALFLFFLYSHSGFSTEDPLTLF